MHTQKKIEQQCIRRLIKQVSITPSPLAPAFYSRQAKVVVFDIYGTLLSSSVGDVGVDGGVGSSDSFGHALVDGGWLRSVDTGMEFTPDLIEQTIQAERTALMQDGVEYPEIEIRQIWRSVLKKMGFTGDFYREGTASVALTALSYECRINPVWPMANLLSVLETLAGTGMEMGILSNAQFYTPLLLETLLDRSLTELGFNPEFCIWSYREKRGKPSQELFLAMHRRLSARGIPPEQVLYIGNDMVKDIIPAREVGWCTILFAGDERSLRLHGRKPDMESGVPDMIINDLSQLTQILE